MFNQFLLLVLAMKILTKKILVILVKKIFMKKIKYIIFFLEKIRDVWFSNFASSLLKHNSFLSFGLQSFISGNITETFLWKKNSLWKYFSYFLSLENLLLKNENKYDSSFKLGAKQFHFRNCFRKHMILFLRKNKFYFNLGAREFHFPKMRKVFFGKR